MRSRPDIDLRAERSSPVAGRDLRVPALVVVAGLVIALAALPGPGGVRVPAEAVAALLAPGAVFFLSFGQVPELPIRLGASVIAVIASWTGVGTAGYAIHNELYGARPPSDGLSILMLIVVYLLGLGTVMMTRSRRLWSGSDPAPDLDADPGGFQSPQDPIEHPSDH